MPFLTSVSIGARKSLSSINPALNILKLESPGFRHFKAGGNPRLFDRGRK
jgi:hypothetical protein